MDKLINLINQIKSLKKGKISRLINSRISEFKALGKKSSREIFKELCFCLLTANFNAKKAIEIQEKIGEGFLTLPERELAKALKQLSYRFPNTRAHYIFEARKYLSKLKELKLMPNPREWLVKNISGLGYKEASHFLRNIGFDDYAIIDFHIINLLARNGLIKKPKTKSLSKNKYLEVENILKKLARKTGLSLSKLDLYLWYLETRKVLK
ncbi:MAG: N-glycosylase/DNA lyase [Candidatus Pacearchaeota archaeon]